MHKRLRERNSRGADVSEVRSRKFKRRRYFRGYEKKIREGQMS